MTTFLSDKWIDLAVMGVPAAVLLRAHLKLNTLEYDRDDVTSAGELYVHRAGPDLWHSAVEAERAGHRTKATILVLLLAFVMFDGARRLGNLW
jgi:hypothetical protein